MTNEKKPVAGSSAGKTSGKANGKAVGGKTAAKTVSKTPGAGVKTPAKTAAKTAGKTPGKAAGGKASVGKAAAAKTAGSKTAAGKAAVDKTAGSKTVAGKTAASKTAAGKTAAGKTAAAKTASKTPVVIKTTARKITSGNAAAAKTVKKEKYSEPAEPKNGWQAFTDEMERSLLAKKAEIIDNLVAGSNDFKEIVEGMDPKDLADIASDDIDRKMIETLGAQELKHLKLIDSALTRIKQGKYGFCIKCDRRIPPDRLEVIPEALMCIECKTAEERRSR